MGTGIRDRGKVRRPPLTLRDEVLYSLSEGEQTEETIEGWLRRPDRLGAALMSLRAERRIEQCTVRGSPGWRLRPVR